MRMPRCRVLNTRRRSARTASCPPSEDLVVQLPKGTMLRDMNPKPGQTPKEIQLFDKQNLLFGIADPDDGRTITRENQVGVRKPVTGGSDEFLDGQLRRIDPDELARTMLLPKAHFDSVPVFIDRRGIFQHRRQRSESGL